MSPNPLSEESTMNRIHPLAIAGLMSAALLAGCQKDHDTTTTTTHSDHMSTTRGSSGYGADDKTAADDKSAADKGTTDKSAANDASATGTADKSAIGASSTSDKDATTAADTDKAAKGNNQGRPARGAHANIEPSKAPGQDDVKGVVRFTPADNGVKVHAEITGLEPNSKHGFHIHEKADLSDPELKSAGGHFNPGMHKHGGPQTGEHHAGDLGNIEADAQGKAVYDVTVEGVTLEDPKTGIIGKSVVIHAKADDLKTDPAGDSGARIAAGVIERGGGREGGGQGRGERRGQQQGEKPRSQQNGQ
jgi:Cu-Zn family superoxide dismutase